MKERITMKGLEKKFNKELGYNFKSFAFSCIIVSLYELKLFDLSLDDINICPDYDWFTVRYKADYYLCTLYKGVHY